MTDRTPVFWTCWPDAWELHCTTRDEAIAEWLDEQGEASGVPDPVTVYGHARVEITVRPDSVLERLLETLDADYGDPDGGDTDITPAMREAETAFLAVVKREYLPWYTERVCEERVDLRAWLAEHDPEKLALFEKGGEQ